MSADQSLQPGKNEEHAADLPRDFESALAELEALVVKMEGGALSLDDSLQAYERGVELARICQQRLDAAEEQVRVLQGSLLKPLDDASQEADA
ncbi:MAG TPA: exodeoxyribonuclease VII small subunit [Burkholderiaceae bacterium]|nr:exodeoxyribonuclease VII small subunit [Burkholderiaceae bacterium]